MKKNKRFFIGKNFDQCGAGMLEILLALALVMALAPYLYYRISDTAREISDISIANRIVNTEKPIMNRENSDEYH